MPDPFANSVFGTPILTGGPASSPVITPPTTQLYANPVPAKLRTGVIVRAQQPVLRAQFVDGNGNPIDLSSYVGPPYTVALCVRENVQWDADARTSPNQIIGTIDSPATDGYVFAALPTVITNNAGIYIAEFAITNDTLYPRAISTGEIVATSQLAGSNYQITTTTLANATNTYNYPIGVLPIVGVGDTLTQYQPLVQDSNVVISTQVYAAIERGLFGTPDQVNTGPPTLAEVRLHLRDFPEVNVLLDDYEFDISEYAASVTRCVDYYNESPPGSNIRYDTRNFPFRYAWLEGIVANLLRTAANWYRRNHLRYGAAGVTVDDLSKEQEYLQAAQLYEQRFEEIVRRQKVRANIMSGFSTLQSEYYGVTGWY